MAKKAIILDTCFFIDHLKTQDPETVSIFNRIIRGEIVGCFSIITDLELWSGIKDKADEYRHKVMLKNLYRYPLTVEISHLAGTLMHKYHQEGFKKPGDAIVAATALKYGLTVCSRDNHFHVITGLSLEKY